ncbi:hypothetical protein MKX01_028786 [Papaver californicum]|nr:hypothetical protein MKX01_028786 [Papaver californicum]
MPPKSPEEEFPQNAFGWAARDTSSHLSPFKFSSRETGEEDVPLKVLYCGVCHSDLHFAKNDWGTTTYPLVPGHEIVGVMTEVGDKVTKVKEGDKVGIGCLLGACQSCDNCAQDLENYCANMILTYNATYHDGSTNYGGYSDIMVAIERYVVRFPDSLPLDAGAPLLCAGITMYSPMKYYGLSVPGKHLGIVGLGGLGHLAVTVISTSPDKKKEATENLGADCFLVGRDPDQIQVISLSCSLICYKQYSNKNPTLDFVLVLQQ